MLRLFNKYKYVWCIAFYIEIVETVSFLATCCIYR